MMYLQMQILSKLCSLTKSLRTPELRQMVLCIFEKGFRVAFLSGENQINSSKTAMQKKQENATNAISPTWRKNSFFTRPRRNLIKIQMSCLTRSHRQARSQFCAVGWIFPQLIFGETAATGNRFVSWVNLTKNRLIYQLLQNPIVWILDVLCESMCAHIVLSFNCEFANLRNFSWWWWWWWLISESNLFRETFHRQRRGPLWSPWAPLRG